MSQSLLLATEIMELHFQVRMDSLEVVYHKIDRELAGFFYISLLAREDFIIGGNGNGGSNKSTILWAWR